MDLDPAVANEGTIDAWLTQVRKGHSRLAVLAVLSKKPLHGYGIIKEIEKGTLGLWEPTPGGIYPILKDLEHEGCVHGEWTQQEGRWRKVHSITEEGRRLFKRAIVRQEELKQGISELFGKFASDTLGVEEPLIPPNLSPMRILAGQEGLSNEERLNRLRVMRERLKEAVEIMKRNLERIERKIDEMEGEKS